MKEERFVAVAPGRYVTVSGEKEDVEAHIRFLIAHRDHDPLPYSCMNDDVLIAMADGSQKRVNQLKPGDVINSLHGPVLLT